MARYPKGSKLRTPEQIKQYQREYYLKNKNKFKEYDRKARLKNPAKNTEAIKRWRAADPERAKARRRKDQKMFIERHPQKIKAHAAVSQAKLVPQPCEICGYPKTEAHHSDYTKPLEVNWLCVPHHNAWHRVFLANT